MMRHDLNACSVCMGCAKLKRAMHLDEPCCDATNLAVPDAHVVFQGDDDERDVAVFGLHVGA